MPVECSAIGLKRTKKSGGEGGIELPFVWTGTAVDSGSYVSCLRRPLVICTRRQARGGQLVHPNCLGLVASVVARAPFAQQEKNALEALESFLVTARCQFFLSLRESTRFNPTSSRYMK